MKDQIAPRVLANHVPIIGVFKAGVLTVTTNEGIDESAAPPEKVARSSGTFALLVCFVAQGFALDVLGTDCNYAPFCYVWRFGNEPRDHACSFQMRFARISDGCRVTMSWLY
ncbi:hypothetical protein B9Z55_005284 [Caenorhabditis nigoni]|uniref:Uncharacterized protein n=1 Tax=Caenorhabditis nigoni TaxID=1611254 RepID=A0A2G5V083_9PELO|nr:hypothetical protein B9Z55_005284 [Caenorhabditis nigoni]